MQTKQLLALATAAALPQLAFDPKNIGRTSGLSIGLTSEPDNAGISIELVPWGLEGSTDEKTKLQAARARYVAAACNAVLPLVQERELLLEACRGAEDALINILGDWAPVTRENLPEEFVGARDAIDALRAAIEQAEGDN